MGTHSAGLPGAVRPLPGPGPRCTALPQVFTYAGWALAELGAEHAEVRRQILAEGLATLVKAANNVQDPRRFVASKLLSVTLRQHGAVVTLAKYRLDLRLLGPQAPVAHPHKPHDHD